MAKTQIFTAYFYTKSTFTKSDYILKEIKPTVGVGGGTRTGKLCREGTSICLQKKKNKLVSTFWFCFT